MEQKKLKHFVKGDDGYCVYCHMAQRDCFCGEDSAELLGYKYVFFLDADIKKGKCFF